MKKVFLTLMLLWLFTTPAFAADGQADGGSVLSSEIGQVQTVETFGEVIPSANGEMNQVRQSVEVKVLSGPHKGEKVIIENMLMGNPAYDIHLKHGDKIILHAEHGSSQGYGGGTDFFIADKYRAGALYFLTVLFFALLLIIGKKKGFYSLISILVTLSLIFWVLTPMVLNGMNPILSTVLVCVFAAIVAIYLVGGLNAKSSSAILGTVISLIIAGLLSFFIIKFASLTGFSSEESIFLFSAYPKLNFVGVLGSAMIIGALGALMDVGMSIASTVNELYEEKSSMGIRALFDSGMNVGRDIIGTMANTLILAYLGGALSLVLLSSNIDMQKFFNLNQVATEISSALIGSVAIVLCVPITAIIAAYLIKKFDKKISDSALAENVFNDIMSE